MHVRLARFGRTDRAFYRIVAIDSRTSREGQPLEYLGTYDPIASRDGVKEVRVKVDRMKYWLSVGAQPSETVARLLAHVGMLPPPPIRYQPQKSQPKGKKAFSTLSWAAAESPSAAPAACSPSGSPAPRSSPAPPRLVSAILGRSSLTMRPAMGCSLVSPLL